MNNNMNETDPIPETIPYSDLPLYTSDEQKKELELLDADMLARLDESRPYWHWGFSRYENIMRRRKDLNERDIKHNYQNTRLRAFLAGSSHPLDEWLKMQNDSDGEGYRRFINESLEDPTKYLLSSEIESVDKMQEKKEAGK
jgi:hypothetical protein